MLGKHVQTHNCAYGQTSKEAHKAEVSRRSSKDPDVELPPTTEPRICFSLMRIGPLFETIPIRSLDKPMEAGWDKHSQPGNKIEAGIYLTGTCLYQ